MAQTAEDIRPVQQVLFGKRIEEIKFTLKSVRQLTWKDEDGNVLPTPDWDAVCEGRWRGTVGGYHPHREGKEGVRVNTIEVDVTNAWVTSVER